MYVWVLKLATIGNSETVVIKLLVFWAVPSKVGCCVACVNRGKSVDTGAITKVVAFVGAVFGVFAGAMLVA